MAALPERKLHLVGDQLVDEDGEIVPKEVAKLRDELEKAKLDLKMAQRDVKAKNRRIAELERNKAEERLQYERYADVERIARYWWRKCRGESARVHYMAPDRFDAVRALLDLQKIVVVEVNGKARKQREPHYTLEDFKRAIDGAAYDPFITTHKNGRQEHHNDLSQICRDSTRFDRFMAKSPRT